MIKCCKDISVPEDSKCAMCCIYCDEAKTCKCLCYGVSDVWKTENEIAQKCVEAYVLE